MVKVNIKWGKEKFQDVELDTSGSVEAFKKQLCSMTGVPVDRQKLMAKGAWKGMLKDDADFSSMTFKPNQQLMLMGAADVTVAPKEKTIFVEDLAPEAKAAVMSLPSGFKNLGNTCYMNSALQCLRRVPELRVGLDEYQGEVSQAAAGDADMTAALRNTFKQADGSVDPIAPMQFVAALRGTNPTFAQQGPRGGFMQQDSEEFLSAVLNSLKRELKKPNGADPKGRPTLTTLGTDDNLIDALFGMKMEQEFKCAESDEEPVTKKISDAFLLKCNIDGGAGKNVQINHLNEGVMLGLEGSVEKQSAVLGRNAVFSLKSRVDRLPRVLCVQFMRFYFKRTPDSRDHEGVKCKMLRPVTFPMTLDTFEFCSDRLKGILKIQRDRRSAEILKELEKKDQARAAEAKDEEMKDADDSKAEGKDAKDDDGDSKMGDADEDNDALQAALAMSMGTNPESGPADVAGIGIPEKFTGQYELFGIVTHKGRGSDGGHYMGFVREGGDNWLCFDDDDVEECKTEHVKDLKGGGDHDMAYLAFYRYTADE